ncbi:MAG: hypothetical protein QOJ44_1443 [Acidimicrobiaceae bacterium]|nr:hypothetical protein [Acidimicrobiaceae bacterium]
MRIPSSPWRRVLLASMVVLVLGGGIGATAYALTADQHPGGDPGGTVLQRLETIRSAVPPGASGVSVLPIAASWMDACAGDPSSHAGWVEDRVNVRFTDTAPATTVKATIDSGLQALGWVRHDIVITRGQGPTAHWSREVQGGRRADAFAFTTPSGSSTWFLTATWQPPGPVVDTGSCA